MRAAPDRDRSDPGRPQPRRRGAAVRFDGRTALVTGASTGIGAAFARRLADRGADLVVVARSEDRLKALADELRREHGRRVDVIAADLARPGSAATLTADLTARGATVDVLVNNAGFATHGDVADADPERLAAQVQLNCATVVELTTRLLPAMSARGHGVVVNVASTAAFQPVPHMAVYSASKAFVLSFTEALWAETRGSGVQVLALCPGATDTPFFDVAGPAASVGRRRSPEQVVTTAFRALERGDRWVVDGLGNRMTALAARTAPRRLAVAVAERSVRA